jgi:hypothetical protein
VRWAYCDVDFCGEPEYELKEDCGTAAFGGYDYRGNISKSATGKKCLPWTHPLSYNTPENRPNAGLEANVGFSRCHCGHRAQAWFQNDRLSLEIPLLYIYTVLPKPRFNISVSTATRNPYRLISL